MARLPRLGVAGWPHLLVQQVHDGQWLARDDTDRQALLEALREACLNHKVALHAYHVRTSSLLMLLTPEAAEAPSRVMQAIGRRYVAAYNRRHGRLGGLWAGRYRGTVLDPARHVLEAMLYVEALEPGHGAAGLGGSLGGAHAEPWSPWSSAPHHLGLRTDAWVVDPPAFWALGNTPFERQAAWRQRLQEGLSLARVQVLAEAVHKGWALMPPEAQARLETEVGRRLSPRPRGRPRKAPD